MTVPKFEQYLKKDHEHNTAAEAIFYAPFVQDMPSWEKYSYDNCMDQCFAENVFGLDNETKAAPIWHVWPASLSSMVNTNVFSLSAVATDLSMEDGLPSLGEIQNVSSTLATSPADDQEPSQLLTTAFHPMKDGDGLVMAYFSWPAIFSTHLHDAESFEVVIKNTCGQQMEFNAPQDSAREADESSFDHEFFGSSFRLDADWRVDGCKYSISLYPTVYFWKSFETNVPLVFAMIVAGTSLIMAIGFYGYDAFIQKIASTVILEAARSNCIISSLFPSNVRSRLFGEAKDENGTPLHLLTGKQQLKSYLLGSEKSDQGVLQGKPIADLFPETTVLFGMSHFFKGAIF